MAAPIKPASPLSTPAGEGTDWKDQAVDTIESLVDTVRDKATKPAITAARAVVYGLVIAMVGVVVVVFLLVAVFRLTDVYLLGWAGRVHGQRREYIPYVVLGLVFSLAGLFCWSRRTAKD